MLILLSWINASILSVVDEILEEIKCYWNKEIKYFNLTLVILFMLWSWCYDVDVMHVTPPRCTLMFFHNLSALVATSKSVWAVKLLTKYSADTGLSYTACKMVIVVSLLY